MELQFFLLHFSGLQMLKHIKFKKKVILFVNNECGRSDHVVTFTLRIIISRCQYKNVI